jgi:hypothetical protein
VTPLRCGNRELGYMFRPRLCPQGGCRLGAEHSFDIPCSSLLACAMTFFINTGAASVEDKVRGA